MSMAYGLISDTKAPVRPGTVIRLTDAELKSDSKDAAATASAGTSPRPPWICQ